MGDNLNSTHYFIYKNITYITMVKQMATASISPRYRITIPREVRKNSGLKAGDRISFLKKGDELVIVKVPKKPLELMEGTLKTKRNVRKTLRDLKKQEAAAEERRV